VAAPDLARVQIAWLKDHRSAPYQVQRYRKESKIVQSQSAFSNEFLNIQYSFSEMCVKFSVSRSEHQTLYKLPEKRIRSEPFDAISNAKEVRLVRKYRVLVAEMRFMVKFVLTTTRPHHRIKEQLINPSDVGKPVSVHGSTKRNILNPSKRLSGIEPNDMTPSPPNSNGTVSDFAATEM
jgi:hypothetical protein